MAKWHDSLRLETDIHKLQTQNEYAKCIQRAADSIWKDLDNPNSTLSDDIKSASKEGKYLLNTQVPYNATYECTMLKDPTRGQMESLASALQTGNRSNIIRFRSYQVDSKPKLEIGWYQQFASSSGTGKYDN